MNAYRTLPILSAALLGGLFLTRAALADACYGYDVVCGLDDSEPDQCSVCWPAPAGGHNCTSASQAEVRLTLPGCIDNQPDPITDLRIPDPKPRDPKRIAQPDLRKIGPQTPMPGTPIPETGAGGGAQPRDPNRVPAGTPRS